MTAFVTSCGVKAIVLVAFLMWYLLVIVLLAGWRKSIQATRRRTIWENGIKISVIIPVRNEEIHLETLLKDLLNQTLLPHEIIVADDHSSDQTLSVARQWAFRHALIKVISLPENIAGKKAALQAAAAISTGDIIATTDADCRVPQQWLAHMVEGFYDARIQLVAGPVLFTGNAPLSGILNTEQLVLQAVVASSFGFGYPLFCSGANMAFRKKAFDEVKGYEGFAHLASGDDVFLMQKMQQRYPQGLTFCAAPGCTVATQPPSSFGELLSQRVRWAGKWRLLSANVQFMALFVFAFQLLILSLPFLAMNWIIDLPFLLNLLAVKWLLEGILVASVARKLHSVFLPGHFLLAQFLYPVYTLTVGILSSRKKTLWKGRTISVR